MNSEIRKKLEELVAEFREAIAQARGEDAAAQTVVEIRNPDAIYVKRPHERIGQIVSPGRLRLMIRYEKNHLSKRAA